MHHMFGHDVRCWLNEAQQLTETLHKGFTNRLRSSVCYECVTLVPLQPPCIYSSDVFSWRNQWGMKSEPRGDTTDDTRLICPQLRETNQRTRQFVSSALNLLLWKHFFNTQIFVTHLLWLFQYYNLVFWPMSPYTTVWYPTKQRPMNDVIPLG